MNVTRYVVSVTVEEVTEAQPAQRDVRGNPTRSEVPRRVVDVARVVVSGTDERTAIDKAIRLLEVERGPGLVPDWATRTPTLPAPVLATMADGVPAL